MSESRSNLPEWLRHELALRSPKGVVVRSETVEQLHSRILAETGEHWDAERQEWVK